MVLPKITIITPTFQTGETVETALLSVANQTYKNLEHLIVDCSSKDKTLPTVRKFQKLHKNVRLLTEKDKGIYDAMNKGLDLCTGDWIYFLGADDSFYNDHVLIDLYNQGLFQEEQVIYGNVIIKGDTPWAKDNSIYDGPFTLEKLFKGNICHQSIFYPKSVIKKVGFYQTKYKVTSDWDYNIKCWAKYKFTYTDMIIACFMTGGKSSEGGDYSLHLDLPDNVIEYFQLDINDSSLYHVTSPFYYPMSRYRENEHRAKIMELEAETERLKQHISEQDTIHSGSLAEVQKQHERSTAALRAEFEESITNYKTEQENLVAALKSDHDVSIKNLQDNHDLNLSNLKIEQDQAMSALRDDYDRAIARLKTDSEQLVTGLKTEHHQVLTKLIEESEHNLIRTITEHDQAMSRLKEESEHNLIRTIAEHDQAISKLKEASEHNLIRTITEYDQAMSKLKEESEEKLTSLRNKFELELSSVKEESTLTISALKEETTLTISALKSDHAESVSTIKNSYEEIIKSIQAEQRVSRNISRQKEAELKQLIASHNQQIDDITQSITDQEQLFKKTVEQYRQEIERLQADIQNKNKEIAIIYHSYTWKIGKIILAPSQFIHRKIISGKK